MASRKTNPGETTRKIVSEVIGDVAAPTETLASSLAKRISLKNDIKPKKDDDQETKRILAIYNFWKWCLGTFLIGAFTAYTTFLLKDYELRLKTRQQETAYLKPYLDNYMSLITKDSLPHYDQVADMAKFLSCAVVDKEYKKGWNDLYSYCTLRTAQLKKTNDSLAVRQGKIKDSILKINSKLHNLTAIPNPDQQQHLQESIDNLRAEFQAQRQVQRTVQEKLGGPAPIDRPGQQTVIIDHYSKKVGSEDKPVNVGAKGERFNNSSFYISANAADVASQTADVNFSSVTTAYLPIKRQTLYAGKAVIIYSRDNLFRYQVTLTRVESSGLTPRPLLNVVTYQYSPE